MTEISAQSLHLIFVTSIYLVPMERKMMFDDFGLAQNCEPQKDPKRMNN
jgi:hypothetical protein